MATEATNYPQGAQGALHAAERESGGDLEPFSDDDHIVRLFATATIVWGLVATLVGLIVATVLVVPSLSDNLP